MTGFISLADVPTLALDDAGGPVRTSIPVARLGSFKDKRYGEFSITAAQAASWKRNLGAVFNGEVPIDYDHGPEKGTSSEAAAWITDLHVSGDKVVADVTFTPQGAQAVRDGRWRYISPTFHDAYVDEEGQQRGPALIGAGLTNRPFLKRGMPAISLSADEFAAPATLLAGDGAYPSDSRRCMPDLAKIRQALKLDSDADEAKVLDAIAGLTPATTPKTLAELAAAEDKIVLSADTFTTLQADAAKGAEAARTLHEQRFETAFEKALNDPKGPRVTPAIRESLKALYDKDADATITMLDNLQPVAAAKPAGTGEGPAGDDVPAGVDEARYELHVAAEAKAKASGITYREAVLALADTQGAS